MRLLYVLITFGFLIPTSFVYSQDYSKNVEHFTSEINSNKKEYSFSYKLPSDGYYFQISPDSIVVPFAIYIKFGELEFWSGFGGKTMNPSFKQRDLTLEEKIKFIGIQPPLVRSTLETKIKSSKPDPQKISGGIEGEKYLVIDQNGSKIAVVKKIGENMFQFRSKTNVPLIDNHSKENEIIFRDNYIKSIYKELNVDPSKQSFVITKGKERDRRDKGICILVDKPSDFYLDYFSEMNPMNRNFIGELVVYKEENKLLEEINASIRSVGGKEITSLFQNGDEIAEKTTEKIARGEVAYLDGIKSYGKILETDKRFSFQKKDGLEELTILVFSPLENSSFNINLNQSPEGLNQVYYKSGQLKEKYTLKNGKLNGEKISYYEDKNYKSGHDSEPIKEIITYVNGLKTGVHKEYELNQNLVLEEDLRDGIRNGKYKKFANGKVIEEGNYVNNEKEGEWTTLNSSVKIFQTYSKGKLNGPFKKYDGDVLRESGQYIEGLKNGEWNYFNRLNDLVLLETYKSNLLNGPYKKYSDDAGKDKIVFNNPEDEFNVSKEFLDLLIHLKFFVGTISNKYLYVNKVKDGIAYIESSHYNKEEKDLINLEIDKWVFSDYISTDKRTEDLSYDFGVDTDWSDLHPKDKKPNLWDRVIEEGTYSNGLKNGKFEFHIEDGTTRNTTYVNDVISKMTISCPELTSEFLKLPPCIVNISINDDLSVQYQAIEFLIKGDNYLKQGDHEKAIYAYRDGIKKYRFQVLFDRIVPLGDYCYQQKHSGHVQDAYEQYLLTKQDGIRQNKFNECKAKSDKFLSEFYRDAEEIVDAMNEEVKRRNSINNEVENRTNSSNSNQNDNESCSKCQGSGKCIECGKPQRVKYYKNGWKNDEEIRTGKTVCTACQGDGITDEHISGGKMDDYKKCYVNTCSNGWIKCRRCNGNGKCDKCNGSGKKD